MISGFSRRNIGLPSLPKEITKNTGNYSITHCKIFIHDGALMVCGGGTSKDDGHYDGSWKCFQLDNGTWKEHSTLQRRRGYSAIVTTDQGTFIFGGNEYSKSYEFLPIGSKKWKIGKRSHSQLPGGILNTSAIEVKSKQEIWLIGGNPKRKRILSFDMTSHTSKELPFELINEREYHACAFIPGTCKILVTGGISDHKHQNSCEIIDTENGTVEMASEMNYARCSHGIGIINLNGKESLVVFGGTQGYGGIYDSIELYNTKTKKWELYKDLELNVPRTKFGFVNNI